MSWRTARSLETLASELDARFPGRVKPDWTIGDAAHRNRRSDHNPDTRGVVTAIDVRGRDTAAWLWNYLLQRRDPRVKYIIHAGRIANRDVGNWAVRRYTGSNPHNDHIHVSVGRGSDGRYVQGEEALYDSTASWGIATAPSPSPAPKPTPKPAPTPTPNDTQPTKAQIMALPLLSEGSGFKSEGKEILQGHVRIMQGLLIAHGNKVDVDGYFGAGTKKVLADWQRRTGKLAADGVCGPATWTWLTGVS